MRAPRFPALCSVLPLLLVALAQQGAKPATQSDTCLAFVARNLAKGSDNFFAYFSFSKNHLKIASGDTLVYSIFLDPSNPEPKGGLDMSFTDGSPEFRELKVLDQNGLRSHGDSLLKQAVGKWETRRFSLEAVKGKTVKDWMINCEGDAFGRYVQFIRDVVVEHKGGTKTVIYGGGSPQHKELLYKNGYSGVTTCVPVPVSLVDTDLKAAIEKVDRLGIQAEKLAAIDQDLQLARKYLETHNDPELKEHVAEVELLLKKIESEDATPEAVEEALHSAQHAIAHTHPQMESYTGHLVGHAHIDLQWLWEWQEGMVATYDTFNQAQKFMDEFPGFTFSQSSSCLYEAVQNNWPELFAKIQAKVKSGQWEIVGGRVCEGDTNMISPESHIRQFLYGQTYFRENFGKTATVGWEPDTFGHTLQMPQILKLGGCDAYYFCRGGKGKPLFWWQGLDGTRILAFDEPASGSWYNSDLSYKQFEEMLDFEKNTGARDSLMVYGIGNHGGGPSREYIETALGWMKDPTKPKVKFSTATQFFDALRKYDLTKIPVVNQELNPVFDGCYTSHAEVKQLNRQSEYATTSAESVSTVASLFGFKYPRESFRKNWEDICFNHHHDTLPGSGIHAPYEKTKTMLQRVIADDKDISMRAMESLTLRVKPEEGGFSVMVFNPSGWTRSGMVRHLIGGTGWEGDGVKPNQCLATGPDGKSVPVVELDSTSHLSEFWASEVPPMGWRVFHLHNGPNSGPALTVDSKTPADGLGNKDLQVTFDTKSGGVNKIVDVSNNRTVDFVGGLGVPILDTEHDDGMSAWVLGKILKRSVCPTVSSPVAQTDGSISFTYALPWSGAKSGESTLKQTFHLEGRQIVVDVDCDWNAIGTPGKDAPLLRLAFDTGFKDGKATYDIPFGSLTRPSDGKEGSSLNWADVSDGSYGIGLLNDSKSGFSCQNGVLRMSMIRSSTGPDPNPNPGRFHWRYAIVPHKGDWRAASLPRLGTEFQQPLMSATVPFDAHGSAPLQWSLLNGTDPNLLITGVKRAEKSDDIIVHMFDAGGQGSKGALAAAYGVDKAWNVNFLEDDLLPISPKGRSVPLDLHPFEIKCLKLRLAKQ